MTRDWNWWRTVESIKRRKELKRLRERLSAEQNHRCCYCGTRTNEWVEGSGSDWTQPTLEHIIPASQGGLDTYDFCVMACRRCNQDRSDRYLEVHHELLETLKEEKVGNDT